MSEQPTKSAPGAGDIYWRYTEPAPRGVKLTLLTIGNIQTTGEWVDGCFKAWCPLIGRNKELERELGIL